MVVRWSALILFLFLIDALKAQDTESEIQTLLEKLRSERVDERQAADRRLRSIGTRAIQTLETAVQDPDKEFALRAAHLVRVIRIREKLTSIAVVKFPHMEDKLATGEWVQVGLELGESFISSGICPLPTSDLAVVLSGALKRAKPSEVVDFLAFIGKAGLTSLGRDVSELIESKDAEVRTSVLRTLADLNASGFSSTIKSGLRDESSRVRLAAVDCLSRVREPGLTAEIVMLLDQKDRETRRATIAALGTLGMVREVPRILPLLKDPDSGIRVSAISALVQLGAKESGESLLPLLEDPEREVRFCVVEAMRALEIKASPSSLLDRLSKEDPEIQILLCATLASRGIQEGKDKLAGFLGGGSPQQQIKSINAIGEYGLGEFVPRLLGKLDGLGRDARQHLLDALKKINSKVAADGIAQLCRDSDPDLRAEALHSLVQSRPARLDELIVAMLRDPDMSVRDAAVRGVKLRQIRLPHEVYETLLSDKSETVRARALEALSAIDPASHFDSFRRALHDQSPFVRVCGIKGLSRFSRDKVGPVIEELLADPQADVRVEAAFSLAAFGSDAGKGILAKWLGESSLLPIWRLNGIRSNSRWRELYRSQSRILDSGSRIQFIREALRDCNMELTIDPLVAADPKLSEILRPESAAPNRRVIDTLDEFLGDTSFELLMTERGPRILRRDDAIWFWSEWLREK